MPMTSAAAVSSADVGAVAAVEGGADIVSRKILVLPLKEFLEGP